MDGTLVSSLKFTTKDMKTCTIADLLERNNISHAAAAADATEQLQKTYNLRYHINLKTEAASVASDTRKATANLAGVLDMDQHDCEMHVVNLTI